MPPEVSIVLPARDAEQVMGCISSLADACPEHVEFDLAVVPVSDDPALHDALTLLEGDVRVLAREADFGAAVRAGASSCDGPWLLVLGERARPTAEVIEALVDRRTGDSRPPVHRSGDVLLTTPQHLLDCGDIVTAALDVVALEALLTHRAAPRTDAGEPFLSACLIVKDEQRLLPRCLASLRGLVDEVVVCDTGSTDRTVEIATAMGATVTHFAWVDDFAAARNAALAAVTGRWVLQVDADEEVAAVAAPALRALLSGTAADAVTVRVTSFRSADHDARSAVESWAPRLLRRGTFRYDGRIHEYPMTADRQRVETDVVAEVTLLHYGYTDEVLAARGKSDRNLHLARLRLADAPADVVARFDYARSLDLAGRRDEAEALFRELLADPRGLTRLAQTIAWRKLALWALHRRDAAAAHDAARAAVDLDPRNAEGRALLAQALLAADRPEEALAALAVDSFDGALISDRTAEDVTVPLLRWLTLARLDRHEEAAALGERLRQPQVLAELAGLARTAGSATRSVLVAVARRLEIDFPRGALALWRGLGDEPAFLLGAARSHVALGEVAEALALLDDLAAAPGEPEDVLFVAALALAAGRPDVVRRLLTTLPLPFPHLAEVRELALAAGADVQEEVERHLAS